MRYWGDKRRYWGDNIDTPLIAGFDSTSSFDQLVGLSDNSDNYGDNSDNYGDNVGKIERVKPTEHYVIAKSFACQIRRVFEELSSFVELNLK